VCIVRFGCVLKCDSDELWALVGLFLNKPDSEGGNAEFQYKSGGYEIVRFLV
jgi:hypothetical protein